MIKLLVLVLAAAPAFAQSLPNHLITVPTVAPSDEAVLAFFSKPETAVARAFAASVAAKDVAGLRECLTLLAADAPPARTQSVLKAACSAELSADELAPAVADARALLGGAGETRPFTILDGEKAKAGEESAKKASERAKAVMAAPAEGANAAKKSGAWYVQWGYNTETYRPMDLRLQQPGKGTDVTLHGVQFRDGHVWDLWNHSVTVPQYGFRVGKFIKPNTAIELNFDHAKAIMEYDQSTRMTGTLNGKPVDQVVRNGDVAEKYKLNNGANFVLVNVVQRLPIVGQPERFGSIAALAKAGAGFMVPHTENIVFGEANQAGFQYGGLGAGVEAAVRLYVAPHVFLEGSQKWFYGRYRNLHIAEGAAEQDLHAHVTTVTAGVSFK